MSRKSVLLSRLGCGLVLLLCVFPALDAWAALSFSPPSVTGTIHYSPTAPALTLTGPVAASVNTPNVTLVGSLSTAGNLSINGVNVPLSPNHGFSYPVTLTQGANTFVLLGVDLGGNRVTMTRTFTLQSATGPTITITITSPTGTVTNQASLTIMGSLSEAGSLAINGVPVVVNPDLSFIYAVTLAQGLNSFTLSAQDAAGNTNTLPLAITFNSAAPSVLNASLISASIVMKDGQTTVTGAAGAAEEGTQLTITDQTSGGASVPVTSGPTGAFSGAIAADAGDVLMIVATDAAGDTSAVAVQVPGSLPPPVITVTTPAGTYTNQPSFTITGYLSEPGTLYMFGTQIPVNPDLSFSYTATNLAEGENSFPFYAFNTAGVESNEPAGTDVTFNDIPPTILITTPGPYTGIVQNTMTGTLSEDATLTITDVTTGGAPVTVPVTFANNTYNFTYPVTLTNGENDFTFTATDPEGNVTTIDFGVTLNSGLPTIQITSGLLTNQALYDLSGHLSKEGSLSINGTTVPVDHDLNFDYQVTLADGDNTFTLDTTDLQGEFLSTSVTVTLSTAPPGLTITSPLSAYTNQPNVTVTGFLDQPGYLSDANGNGNSIPVNQDDWSFSLPMTLQEGLNTYTFQVEDDAGNIAQVPWSITLDTIPPAINVPLISAVDGTGADTGQATLSGPAGAITDAGDGNVSSLTVASVDNTTIVPATSDATGAFSVTLTGSAEDPFNITATDEVGNSDSVRVQFGTACYTGGSTDNTTLTVANGNGTLTGPDASAVLFPITRTGELGFDTYVDYQTQGATAVSGQEYTGSFKIPAGSASANLSIPVLGSSSNASAPATFTLNILGTHNFIQNYAVLGQQSYAVGNNPWVVIAADINGDGKPDLITVNNDDGTISVLLNTTPDGAPQATFAPQQTFPVGTGPSSVVAVDLNNDQKLDLVVTNSLDNTITILTNTTPTDSNTVSFTTQTLPTGNDPSYVAAADFNGDHKPDIVVLDGDPDDNVLVYLNATATGAPSASFSPSPQTFAVGSDPTYLIAADINGDNLPDIITANTGDNTVSVLLNTTGTGASQASFAAQQVYSVDSPQGMAVADVNGDGVPDLLVTNQVDGTVSVMLNTTPQGGTSPSFATQTFNTGAQPSSVAVANMYGDVNPALVVGNAGDNTVSVLRNLTATGATTASFAAQTVYQTGVDPWPAITADLNHSGKSDIVTANQAAATVSVLMNANGAVFGSCVMPASVTGTVQYDVDLPVITITSPSGTSTQSPYQTLSGSVSEQVASLTINGTALTQNPDDTFSENIRLQPGTNSYLIVATDASGNAATLNLVLTLNSPSLPTPAASSIQFLAGTPGSGQVVISGTAPAGATEVTVLDITNGNTMSDPVNPDGSFSVTLTGNLSDQFSVSFSDASGDQSPPVFANGNDPSLSLVVTSPTANASVAGSMVDVTGTYTGPLDTGITVNGQLATVTNGHFYANNINLALGANTLTVVATTVGGLSVSQTLSVTGTAASPLILAAQSGDVGVSSLNVGFSYTYTGSAALQTLEMDYLGTGFNVVATGSQIPAYAVAYDYTAPGTYPASIRLTDVNGVQYVATVYIVVQDPTQMDALFTSIWGDMTTALSERSEPAALNVLDYTAQQKYGPVFDALLPNMSTIVASFSPLLQSSFTPTTAEYAVVRTQSGIKQFYLVYFIQDSNGVWRLDGM